MVETQTNGWRTALEQLSDGTLTDDPTVLTFIRGDLVDGLGRTADIVTYGTAWQTVLERAPSLAPTTIDTLMSLGAAVPSGAPMRGLVAVLRTALAPAVLDAKVATMPEGAAKSQLAYWLTAPTGQA